VQQEVKKKRNRQAVARHSARAKGEATEPPLTRKRAKKGIKFFYKYIENIVILI
jgi:hypothetical protein